MIRDAVTKGIGRRAADGTYDIIKLTSSVAADGRRYYDCTACGGVQQGRFRNTQKDLPVCRDCFFTQQGGKAP